jgi:hypothetical protein
LVFINMKRSLILAILFFLISFSAQSQPEIKSLIGKSKEQVKAALNSQTLYTLRADSVHIQSGELLHYRLKDLSDSALLKHRILTLTFFFEKSRCDEIRMVLYGSDALVSLVDRLNRSYRRVGVNVWIDDEVKVGLRITQLPSIEYGEGEIELFQIEMKEIDFWKN